MSVPFNSAGLGADTDYRIDCNTGMTIDCGAYANFFNMTCWGLCSAGTLAPGTTAPVGGSGSPGGSTTPPPLSSPSIFCTVLDCDASGNVTLDSTNIIWIGGAALVVMFLVGAFQGGRRR